MWKHQRVMCDVCHPAACFESQLVPSHLRQGVCAADVPSLLFCWPGMTPPRPLAQQMLRCSGTPRLQRFQSEHLPPKTPASRSHYPDAGLHILPCALLSSMYWASTALLPTQCARVTGA